LVVKGVTKHGRREIRGKKEKRLFPVQENNQRREGGDSVKGTKKDGVLRWATVMR